MCACKGAYTACVCACVCKSAEIHLHDRHTRALAQGKSHRERSQREREAVVASRCASLPTRLTLAFTRIKGHMSLGRACEHVRQREHTGVENPFEQAKVVTIVRRTHSRTTAQRYRRGEGRGATKKKEKKIRFTGSASRVPHRNIRAHGTQSAGGQHLEGRALIRTQ